MYKCIKKESEGLHPQEEGNAKKCAVCIYFILHAQL